MNKSKSYDYDSVESNDKNHFQSKKVESNIMIFTRYSDTNKRIDKTIILNSLY